MDDVHPSSLIGRLAQCESDLRGTFDVVRVLSVLSDTTASVDDQIVPVSDSAWDDIVPRFGSAHQWPDSPQSAEERFESRRAFWLRGAQAAYEELGKPVWEVLFHVHSEATALSSKLLEALNLANDDEAITALASSETRIPTLRSSIDEAYESIKHVGDSEPFLPLFAQIADLSAAIIALASGFDDLQALFNDSDSRGQARALDGSSYASRLGVARLLPKIQETQAALDEIRPGKKSRVPRSARTRTATQQRAVNSLRARLEKAHPAAPSTGTSTRPTPPFATPIRTAPSSAGSGNAPPAASVETIGFGGKLFLFEGTLNQGGYALVWLAALGIALALAVVLALLPRSTLEMIALLYVVASHYVVASASTARLRDIGVSPAWAIMSIIPFAVTVLLVWGLAAPTKKPSR